MRKLTSLLLLGASVYAASAAEPVDYVSTLVGTESKYSLSTGNTYPAVAMPWGLNIKRETLTIVNLLDNIPHLVVRCNCAEVRATREDACGQILRCIINAGYKVRTELRNT